MQFAWGFATPLIIEAAVKNRYFDTLAGQPMNIKELAAATGTSLRGVQAIMDALVGFGLASRNQEGRYVLNAESEAFLVSSRPGFLGGFFTHMSRDLVPAFLSLSECVQSGEPVRRVDAQAGGAEFFRDFVEALFPLAYPAAMALGKSLAFPANAPIRVLDIAAGSGVWGIGIARTNPQAHVSAIDWEGVLPVTKNVVARHGLSDRFNFISGDILEAEFGGEYDVATLGQILHSEGYERSRELLRRVFKALKPGGRVAIAEFVVNEDRSGPPQALIFSVNMLVNTREGRAFSFAELSEWLRDTGFTDPKLLDIPAPSIIVATRPAV